MEVTQGGGPAGGMTRGTRVSIFVNVVLICALGAVLALALVWLVGRLGWKHDLRLDLTRDQRFTIDPVAERVLRELNEPVHATFVYGIDDEIRRRALDFAGQPREDILNTYYRPILYPAASLVQSTLVEWARISELFTFDAIDADREPQRMTDVAMRRRRVATDLARDINQVVFECGGRRRAVPMGRMFAVNWGWFPPDPRSPALLPEVVGKPRVQSELTEAMRALAAGETVRIGFPAGLATAIPYEGPEWDALKEFLVNQGFEPVTFDLVRGVPGDVAMVAIIGAGRSLLPEEARALRDYEASGGRMLILADPRKPEDYAAVFGDAFGVRFEPAVVEDPQRAMPGQRDQTVLLHNELCAGNHEIDRPVARRIGLYAGMSRPLRIEDLRAPGAERIVLLQGSPDAKSVPAEYRRETGEADFVFGAKKTAPKAPIAVVMRRPTGGGESRIVAFGGWEIIAPRFVSRGTHYGNRDLVLNALNWIADKRAPLGIIEREAAASRVDITESFLATYRWLVVAGLPGMLALFGIVAALRRRN